MPRPPDAFRVTTTSSSFLATAGSAGGALVERFDAIKFGIFQRNLSNFRGLVLFCIEADFCDKILIFQQFSRSTVAPIGRKKVHALFFSRKKIRKNAKKFYEILLRFSLSTGAKECQSCRSRKMLKNAYLDAKIGFDTEENEPSKV